MEELETNSQVIKENFKFFLNTVEHFQFTVFNPCGPSEENCNDANSPNSQVGNFSVLMYRNKAMQESNPGH